MVNITRTLEIAGTSGFIQPIKLVQYDDTLPVGVFELVENGQPFDIPAGAKAKVRMRKADGKGVYNDAVISGDTVQVVFTQQMTAAFGVGFLNIELSYDGGVKSSEPVQVVVLENAVQQGAIESSDEFLTLDEIVKQVETLRQQTATDAASAAASKTAAASSATAAQAARQGAEAAESRVNAIVAGNESYTKRQSRNLFARALKAETDKAASLEIYPDEGSNVVVTAYGYTEQAGSGDPSPTNVRQITVGGLQANLFSQKYNTTINGVSFTFDGAGKVIINGTASGDVSSVHPEFIGQAIDIPAGEYTFWCKNNKSFTDKGGCSFRVHRTETGVNELLGVAAFTTNGNGFSFKHTGGRIAFGTYIGPGSIFDNNTIEIVLNKGKTAAPYTPYTGAEYGTVAKTKGASEINKLIPLTDPLCDGDTVETCVKSGCDKRIVFDGSEDEGWTAFIGAPGVFYIDSAPKSAAAPVLLANRLTYRPIQSGLSALRENEFAVQFVQSAIRFIIRIDSSSTNADVCKAAVKANPITFWYRSTEYTSENDIPVCRETHKNAYKEYRVADMNNQEDFPGWRDASLPGIVGSGVNSAVHGSMINIANPGKISANTRGSGLLFFTKETLGGLTQTDFKSTYPNLVVQVTLPYKTPITYAHDPVYLEAYPDGNGKFTVSGEKLVSAFYNKSLSKAFEELQSAVLAMGANLSS